MHDRWLVINRFLYPRHCAFRAEVHSINTLLRFYLLSQDKVFRRIFLAEVCFEHSFLLHLLLQLSSLVWWHILSIKEHLFLAISGEHRWWVTADTSNVARYKGAFTQFVLELWVSIDLRGILKSPVINLSGSNRFLSYLIFRFDW